MTKKGKDNGNDNKNNCNAKNTGQNIDLPSECVFPRPGISDDPPDSLLHCRVPERLSPLQFNFATLAGKESKNLLVISKGMVDPGGRGRHVSNVESLEKMKAVDGIGIGIGIEEKTKVSDLLI